MKLFFLEVGPALRRWRTEEARGSSMTRESARVYASLRRHVKARAGAQILPEVKFEEQAWLLPGNFLE